MGGKKTWVSGEKVFASDINDNFSRAIKFGGDGSDGALSVASGTTTIDAGGAKVVVKQYSSINIASGAELTISNPHDNGTILIIKCSGDVTIDGLINLTGMGALNGTTGQEIQDDLSHHGGDGGNASAGVVGSAGSAGAIYSNKFLYITADEARLYRNYLNVACGSGGGDGGDGYLGGAGGEGGRGGGGLIIECGGELDFNATGEIRVDGGAGSAGNGSSTDANAGAGGGGGGTAGMALVLYKELTANSGTINARGGAGGDGGDGGDGTRAGSANYKSGGSGGGGGAYSSAGKAGKAGVDICTVGTNGTNAVGAEGASGGSGGGGDNGCGGVGVLTGGTGGTQGSTDSTHYLIAENIYR